MSEAGPLRRLIHSAGIRVAVLPLSGLATILSARLLTSEYGTATYAIFTLIASLPALLPIADFGLGAAVTNAAAALPLEAPRYAATVRRTRRLLLLSGAFVASVSILLGLLELWPSLLGVDYNPDTNVGASVALVLYGVSIPFSLGGRILIGLRKNTIVVLMQGIGPVLSLALVWVATVLEAPPSVVLSLTMVGQLLVAISLSVMARRIRSRWHDIPEAGLPPVQVWRMAGATVALTIALPLAFQAHRLLISWTGDLSAVATYSAGAIAFFPVLSVIQMGGQSLWGDFARARDDLKESRRLLVRANIFSVALAAAGALALVSIGPFIAGWSTNGLVSVPWSLFAGFGLIVLIQGWHISAGMLLTDERGMKFQAITSSCMAIVSVTLGALLVPSLGPSGPVYATALALLVCHAAPCQARAFASLREPHRD